MADSGSCCTGKWAAGEPAIIRARAMDIPDLEPGIEGKEKARMIVRGDARKGVQAARWPPVDRRASMTFEGSNKTFPPIFTQGRSCFRPMARTHFLDGREAGFGKTASSKPLASTKPEAIAGGSEGIGASFICPGRAVRRPGCTRPGKSIPIPFNPFQTRQVFPGIKRGCERGRALERIFPVHHGLRAFQFRRENAPSGIRGPTVADAVRVFNSKVLHGVH